jgi:tetratricopeptide (TPR) repeat protein
MESIKQMITLGKQYFDQKQYKKAEHYFKKVISLNSGYADVLNMLGVITHIEGKFSEAMDLFKRALKINPNYTEALLNLTVLLNDLGKYTEAKKLYGQLKRGRTAGHKQIEPVLRGKLSNLHSDIGEIYRSIGLYDLAIEEYKKALHLNPAYVDIRTKLGQAYRESGQLPVSLKELKEVLKSRPNYSPARIQLGVTLYSMGKISSAKKEWKTVLAKDADNEYAKMYLRLCEAQANKEPLTAAQIKTKKFTAKTPGHSQ